MRIEFSRRFESGFDLLDTDIERLALAVTASGTFLYSSTGTNGGMLAWRVDGRAVPTVTDSFYFPGSLASMATLDLCRASFNGNSRVIFGVTQGGDLLTSNSTGPADFGRQTTVRLDDAHSPWLQNGILTAELRSGADMIYVADAISGALNGYAIDRDGIPRWVSATASPTGRPADATVLLDMVSVANQDFLLRADCRYDGVVSYRVNADGTLVRVGSLGAENGLGVNDPTVMSTVSAFGKTFVLLGAAGSGTISVMVVTATGSLRPTDHLLDTLDSRFGTITSLQAVETGGRVFVVAGGGDDGLSLFTLLPDGRLVHLQALPQSAGLGLDNIASVAMTVVGTEIRIFVASGTQPGMSQFRIDLSHLGATLNGAASGSLLRQGGAEDDLLVSNSSGHDTLMGLVGDDILATGTGGTVMFGGAGADTFVIRASANRHYVMDYSLGDRIDLSGWPMLHATSQLTATPTDRGILLGCFGNSVEIVSATGRPLALTDIWSGVSFGLPDRLMVLGELAGERIQAGNVGGLLQGTIGRDTLIGGGGADTIQGLDAKDIIYGYGSNDLINAGAGNDRVNGDAGNDTVSGADGDDDLLGGSGADSLYGGAGNDTLGGEAGNDRLTDGSGTNVLSGGAGADTILAGWGNDLLVGGPDAASAGDLADVLNGGGGNDRLKGGAGSDSLLGGTGNDTLQGGSENDRIEGGAGDDVIFGDAGNDILFGGLGNDDFLHTGASALGSDRVCDFASGDTLVFQSSTARIADFGLRWVNLAGSASADDAQIIYRPTGAVLWTVIDAENLQTLHLQLGTTSHYLLV